MTVFDFLHRNGEADDNGLLKETHSFPIGLKNWQNILRKKSHQATILRSISV